MNNRPLDLMLHAFILSASIPNRPLNCNAAHQAAKLTREKNEDRRIVLTLNNLEILNG